MKTKSYKLIILLIISLFLMSAESLLSTDQWNSSRTGTVNATVLNDTDPPEIHNCPANITINTGTNSGNCSAVATWTAPAATDNHRVESFTSNYTSGQTFPVGTTTVTYTATDPSGNTRTCSFTVTVVDHTQTHISITLSSYELWPPNHRMVDITATITTNDNCSSTSSGLTWVLESITSNEADNGYGDGDTPNDIQNASYGTADTHFSVRRERSGRGNDRIYTVTYKATDAAGNVTRAIAAITRAA